MNFIDKVRVFVRAGDGGNGCLSFLREKFLEFGGPNGGDGGRGGDVWLEAAPRLTTLMDLRYNPHVRARSGGNGKGSHKTGDSGPDLVVPVPAGTVVYRDGRPVADLCRPGERWRAAEGGRGGRGNASFKSRMNTAPRLAEKGAPGEEAVLDLELKLLADVGLVGFPNAGKSSLLARLTRAKPKIADYPFTTLAPNLGVAAHKSQSFVLADIPGLIEGASSGKGLGDQFLRHVERTRVLVHLVDPAGYAGQDPLEGIKTIEAELKAFSPRLAAIPRLLALNKSDLPGAEAVYRRLRAKYRGRVLSISAATGEGLEPLLDRVIETLAKSEGPAVFAPPPGGEDLRRVEQGFTVESQGGGRFLLRGRYVERASAMLDAALPEAVQRFQLTLKRIGVDRALRKAGIKPGDAVRCGGFEFEWTDAPLRRLPAKRRDPRTRIGVGKK